MFVAQELRKKSIAEYLLYMWQIEDIIRAYGCSLPVIKKNYVDRFDFTPEQREEELDWFGNLIRMMNEEGKREGGHLNINKVILKDVIDLHGMLLQSTKFPIYNAEYYKVLPFIVELRQRGDKDLNEIETCPLRCDDAAPAEEGNHARNRKGHQGDYRLHRSAQRLLHQRPHRGTQV